MLIRWFGQSAFLLQGTKNVLIDPFGKRSESMIARGLVFDYEPIGQTEADVLLITHEHSDHNAAGVAIGTTSVIRSAAGTFESPLGDVVAIASEHDPVAGTESGANVIFRFNLDGLRLCHLGDLGQSALRAEQKEAIGDVDVLFLPIGGSPTIGGSVSADIVRELNPRLVVPMHYRTAAVNFLEPPDEFIDNLGQEPEWLERCEFDADYYLGSPGEPSIVLPSARMSHEGGLNTNEERQ